MRTNRSASTSTSVGPLHHQVTLVPGQTQLAQGADLRVGHEASAKVRLRVGARRCHPRDGHVDDLVSKGAERAAVGLGEQHPGETLVVHQCADERLQPRLWRPTGSGGPERIDPLRHHGDGVVDDGALELGEGGEALVEVALGESGLQTHPPDAERARALGSGDRKGGLHQPVPPIAAPVIGADPFEGHRHLVVHAARQPS